MTDLPIRSPVQPSSGVPNLVASLTDYGLGPYRALLEVTTRRYAPDCQWIDLDHDVALGDVRAGALTLRRVMPQLPPCVCVGVVDPGVGTARRPVALRTASGHHFVGPDNGLFEPVVRRLGGVAELVDLTSSRVRGQSRARTFDGRDLFAPVAGSIVAGASLSELGDAADPGSLMALALPSPRRTAAGIEASVLEIDRFGTLVLALDEQLSLVRPLPAIGEEGTVIAGPVRRGFRKGTTYADVAAGDLVLFRDSDEALALARRDGSASQLLLATHGTPITLEFESRGDAA